MTPTDRLHELAAQYELPPESPERLAALLARVAAAPLALTTVRDPADAVERHIADSLAGLTLPQLRAARSIADLGSGGGFPGLVLALALPEASVALVESVGKKAAFLEATATELGLAGRVAVVAERAEAWPEGVGAHDAVTARALAPLPVLVEYAAPLLVQGGVLVAWKGARDAAEEADAAAAAAALTMSPPAVTRVAADAVRDADERHLYLSSKVGPTPAGYPRRPGMARKRPHRASS